MNRSQAKSDLLWAINSPSLLSAQAVGSLFPCSLDEAEIDERRLIEFMNRQPSQRVGRYFERLIEFYLRYVAGFELIATQQQVCVGGQTIGEIDFLYRDCAGRLTHLEVAVKFYLYWPNSTVHGSHYLGPNTNDTLERKAKRIREHQLPLSRRIDVDVQVRQAMVKGAICYPRQSIRSQRKPEDNRSPILAADHARGCWINADQIEKSIAPASLNFMILQKPYWLNPDSSACGLDRNEFHDFVQQHFSNSDRPIHAWINDETGDCERLFVVSNRWPRRSGS